MSPPRIHERPERPWCAHSVLTIDVNVAEMNDLEGGLPGGREDGRVGGRWLRERHRVLIDRRRLAEAKDRIAELGRCLAEQGEVPQVVGEDGALRADSALADVSIFDLGHMYVR